MDEIAEVSSFAGTAGAVSVAAGLAASFLPNRPPKIEARLFGLGAVSRVVDVGVVSAAMGAAAPDSAAVAAGEMSSTAVEFPPAGRAGSPTTRAAVDISKD